MANNKTHVSRRDFARKAALLGVAAPLMGTTRGATSEGSQGSHPDDQNPPNLPADFPKLSDQSRAEADDRYQAILNQYGFRFSAEQKTDLRRLCFLAQPPLDQLRAYTIQNGDSPALYLKPIVEREKKPGKTPVPLGAATKKPSEAKR